MAFGMFCGPGANGSRLKKNGSMSPVAFCMSGFKLGSNKVCLKNCSRRWSNTMPEHARLAGNGNR
jgi:hypothetical protein